MNTCKTCRWWNNKPNPDWDIPSDYGVCESKKVGLRDYVELDFLTFDGYPEYKTGLAIAGPNFGCIHHKSKD